ncbi:beta-caryophyllene synthase-like [Andrographis paniculata]|uniref:beta-caryophyllene synthase-like n=1 Tax=Andrographis paniculata TaxID=175694 RepID=UPI0021E91CB8|nr:beta-caryophyllene synthase-like [Andrographis paniculata]QJA18344.1 terpene synthase 29 [Andrographis paniculata]
MEMYASTVQSLEDVRRSVKYHPTIWGDKFLSYASAHEESSRSNEEEELQKLKEEVKKLLSATPNDSLHKLELIDAIQRLGVGYHFEKEIDETLKIVYDSYLQGHKKDTNDVYVVALCFRLLRQQGHNISSDVFDVFLNEEGKFKDSLAENVEGILSLYEAAQYGIHGEEILDLAKEFALSHLESIVSKIRDTSLAARVEEAIETPIHKSLNRLHAAKFIRMYRQDECRNELLLAFAKLDFNLLQKMHQKEISDLTRWWKALDFRTKLPFARDRMVECYFWILGLYFEPQFYVGRIILSKVIMLASTIDDIYDVHGTFDELQKFTEAITRWDTTAMEKLPPYMKTCYQALLNVYEEIEELARVEDSATFTNYAKEEMKKLVQAYFKEAERLFNGEIPTLEEYMKVGLPSSGYMMVAVTSLIGMGGLVSKEDFDWVSREPSIVRATSLIARLMDDMAGYEFEKKLSAVECYMNDKNATKEEAFDELEKQVRAAWKDINQECLYRTAVSLPVLTPIANSARVIYLIYKDGDGYTNSKIKMKEAIESVLLEPVVT